MARDVPNAFMKAYAQTPKFTPASTSPMATGIQPRQSQPTRKPPPPRQRQPPPSYAHPATQQTTNQPRRTTKDFTWVPQNGTLLAATVRTVDDLVAGDAPLLPAAFEGLPAHFFVDSGSAVSLVPLSTLVNFKVLTPVRPSKWCVRAASGTSLKVMGEVKLNITLSEDAHLPGDLLLGYNFMRKAEIHQQPDRDTITHQGNVYRLTTPNSVWHSSSNPAIDPTPDDSPKDDRTRRSSSDISTPAQDFPNRCHKTSTKSDVKTSKTLPHPSLSGTSSFSWAPQTDAPACIVTSNLTLPPFTDSMVPVRVTSTDGTALITPDCIRVKGLCALPAIYESPLSHLYATRQLLRAPLTHPDLPTDRPLGRTDVLRHRIDLIPGTKPIYIPSYRIPHSRRAAFKEATDALLAQGIIEPSQSPWSAPMLLVPKKDGTLRPVIDYRRLNAATVPDRYPIPSIGTLFQEVGEGHAIFSSIDLAQGFLQVEMDPTSKDLTAFSTPHGHFAFTRMPFGLRNSPITFSRLMSLIMQGLIGDTAFLYLDDLLIASKDVAEHEYKLKLVFQRLADANLTINVKKCQFFRKQTEYLGHTVDSAGLRPNDKKVRDVQNFPVPTTATQVKSFLGLCGFYRPFIEKFGIIAEPLTRLLRKDTPFTWTGEQQQAFEALKQRLTEAPVLSFPDFNETFYLATDASSIGLGAALMQRHDGRYKPIAFASRKLNKAERNYSVTDLEALAVVWSLKHFREIILGYDIHVLTDHRPLKYILTDSRHAKGRQARWIDTLLEFNPKIDYTPGSTNKVADALSRNVSVNHLSVLSPTELQAKQRDDPLYAEIIAHLEDNTNKRPIRKLTLTCGNHRKKKNQRNCVDPSNVVRITNWSSPKSSSLQYSSYCTTLTLRDIKVFSKLFSWLALAIISPDLVHELSNTSKAARSAPSTKDIPLPQRLHSPMTYRNDPSSE
ncbi:putative enzymatic polyprotein [Penaeus vannamei]|uniref:RNA-directed DNA polymerase n=1 Tax=Penaeus vannamei TaxID=6689 RepID=A0A423TFX5_PENVA|nr:putative enzymatic polyprotein [Penaeus vannamei]